eukprot:COSAG05_NODE_1572_length_4520_cov_2.148157_4_plen_57_part_00
MQMVHYNGKRRTCCGSIGACVPLSFGPNAAAPTAKHLHMVFLMQLTYDARGIDRPV